MVLLAKWGRCCRREVWRRLKTELSRCSLQSSFIEKRTIVGTTRTRVHVATKLHIFSLFSFTAIGQSRPVHVYSGLHKKRISYDFEFLRRQYHARSFLSLIGLFLRVGPCSPSRHNMVNPPKQSATMSNIAMDMTGTILRTPPS